MSALAGYAVVEGMHGEIDERVGQAPVVVATVVLAIALASGSSALRRAPAPTLSRIPLTRTTPSSAVLKVRRRASTP